MAAKKNAALKRTSSRPTTKSRTVSPYVLGKAEGAFSPEALDRVHMADRVVDRFENSGMSLMGPLFKKGEFNGAVSKQVEGRFINRNPMFSAWLWRDSLHKLEYDELAAHLDFIDDMLDAAGLYNASDREMIEITIRDGADPEALWRHISPVYGKSGVFVRCADKGTGPMIDVGALMASVQCLLGFLLATWDMVEYYNSCICNLGPEVERCGKLESSLKSANDRVAQLKSTLESRPTKGDVTRLEKKVAALEGELSAARAELEELRSAAAAAPAPGAGPAGSDADMRISERIDELVRLQSESEDAARAAAARADAAEGRLAESEGRHRSEMEDAEAEIERLKKAMADIGAATPEQVAAPVGSLLVADLAALPSDPVSVLELAADVFDGRIAVADTAYDSASGYNGDAGEVWRVLRALATEGYDLYFGDGSFDTRNEFESRTGFELSTSESKGILSKAERREREIVHNGRKYDISAHVKGSGRKSSNSLRVHFAVDRDDSVIVVGYCGEHLKSRGTKKRGW